MPNHVTNILIIKDVPHVRIEQILNSISGMNDDGEILAIDFNKIIPMPESLHIEDGSDLSLGLSIFHRNKLNSHNFGIEEAMRRYEALSDHRKENIKRLADTAADNIDKYGHATWHNWAIENWGTKWNAYDIEEIPYGVQFNTAWSTPFPVIVELSMQYPDATFEVSYADEDIGNNCGRYELKNGVIVEQYFPPMNSDEAYEFAINILGLQGEIVKDNNGDWIWADDIDDDGDEEES